MPTSTKVLTRSVIEKYINAKQNLTTESRTIYECPSNIKAAIVLLAHVANTDTLNDSLLSIGWRDNSDNNNLTYLLKEGNIPARAALNVLHSKLILEPNDSLIAYSSEPNRLDLTLSILEIS